jgi:hypothetical protein
MQEITLRVLSKNKKMKDDKSISLGMPMQPQEEDKEE